MKYAITSARQSIDSYGQEIVQFETEYAEYLSLFGYQVLILPLLNDFCSINNLYPDLILLPGGGDVPAHYYNSIIDVIPQKRRNSIEYLLIDYAIKQNIPILGICRGMQLLNGYFGGKITREVNQNHPVALNHNIKNTKGEFLCVTNSFHQDVIRLESLSTSFKAIAFHESECHVEAMVGIERYILGIQWHPERMKKNNLCCEYTNNLIQNFLKKKELL